MDPPECKHLNEAIRSLQTIPVVFPPCRAMMEVEYRKLAVQYQACLQKWKQEEAGTSFKYGFKK